MNDLNIVNAKLILDKKSITVGVSIKKGLIADVNRPGRLKPAKETLDAEGAYVIPSFTDTYNRLNSVEELIDHQRAYIRGGYTSTVVIIRSRDDQSLLSQINFLDVIPVIDLLFFDSNRATSEYVYFKPTSLTELDKLRKYSKKITKIYLDLSDVIAERLANERDAIEYIFHLLKFVNRIYIYPITVIQGVRAINRLRRKGIRVFCGSNVYNLIVHTKLAEKLPKDMLEGLRIRAFTHSRLLIKSLRGKSINALGTSTSLKNNIASSSARVLYNLVYEEKILIDDFIQALSIAPEMIFLEREKKIKVGEKADLVLLKEGKFRVLDGLEDLSVPRGIFSGWDVRANIDAVIRRGKILYLRGEFLAT
ncbi:MAG: hypothetical protein DRZ76_04460 [Candidatus Nealsonbacteria bacterium]|nr:MAG: hypothetical protein DRZ76_04460 [Candidatus Nealsonbacteria bacterium]